MVCLCLVKGVKLCVCPEKGTMDLSDRSLLQLSNSTCCQVGQTSHAIWTAFYHTYPQYLSEIMSDNYTRDIWCQNDIASTSRQLHRVASTLTRRHLYVMCPLGSSINRSNRMLPKKFKSQSTVTYMRLRIYNGLCQHRTCL